MLYNWSNVQSNPTVERIDQMQLHLIRIKNFRCYKDEITTPLTNLTALIARNDAGKSSILDALDGFFNKDKLEPGDRSIGVANNTPIEITCIFKNLPDTIIVDSDNLIDPTTEYLLNEEGFLEITAKYKGATPALESVQVNAVTPTAANFNDLFDLTLPQLRTRANNLGVNLEGVNQTIKSPIRHAIWQSVDEAQLQILATPIEVKDTIWKALKNMLPLFQLFKADRPSSDQDSEAQDPIKFAIKESLKQVQNKLDEVEAHVKRQIEEVTKLTIEKIREMDATLANELNPVIKPPSWANSFKVTLTNEEQIPLNKRGSGVRRLFLINFFRAKAEQQANLRHTSNVIYAIEEPETSQHPNNQILLLEALRELADEDGSQVLITTHNPILAGKLNQNCLRFIDIDGDGKLFIRENNEDTSRLIANSLGIFANHNIKVFVGVEGPNDIEFLRRISEKLNQEDASVANLSKHEDDGDLIFIPMGGQTIELWSTRLEGLNIPEVHIFDRDNEPPEPGKYQDFADSVNARGEHCCALMTSKREMENYLHHNAINEALGTTLENINPFDDVPTMVAQAIHENSESPNAWNELSDKKKDEKIRKAKKQLNRNVADLMTSELLHQSDVDREVLIWLQRIQQHLN